VLKMLIKNTNIAGVKVVTARVNEDHRGSFSRSFCMQEFQDFFKNREITQINLSQTNNIGTVRGIHFQYPPKSEMKIVRCIIGRIWDVVVDVRRNSTTFLKWYAEELTAENNKMMVIPEGVAHGFQVLEKAQLLYMHTNYYDPKFEGALRYDDPKLNIEWPLKVTNISDRDSQNAFLNDSFDGIQV